MMTHICIFDDDLEKIKANANTREGNEAIVLQRVRECGGFSVFWATDNQKRACAIVRLENAGVIARVDGHAFPFCGYRINQ